MTNFLSERRGRLARPIICRDKRVLFLIPSPTMAPPFLEVQFWWLPPGGPQSLLFTIGTVRQPDFLHWYGSAEQHGAIVTAWITLDLPSRKVSLSLDYTSTPCLHWSVTSPARDLIVSWRWYLAWPTLGLPALPPVHDASLRD
jgi:hypothetical protein